MNVLAAAIASVALIAESYGRMPCRRLRSRKMSLPSVKSRPISAVRPLCIALNYASHAVAVKQMKGGFGGMMSLRLKAGEEAAKTFTARLRVFKRATSLGSVESLAEHRASVEGPGTQCPADLVRLSIGVEHIDDLIGDIEEALG